MKGYIRLGDLPPDGRSSAGPRTEEWLEPGVSVYAAEFVDGCVLVEVGGIKDVDLVEPPMTRLQASLTMYCSVRRPVYVARGRRVASGGDGEPCLVDVEIEPLPDDVPLVPSPSHPLLDGWAELHNAFRAGGFVGFHMAVQRLTREGRCPTMKLHGAFIGEVIRQMLWMAINQPSADLIKEAADMTRDQARY